MVKSFSKLKLLGVWLVVLMAACGSKPTPGQEAQADEPNGESEKGKEETEAQCKDGKDNDGNGLVDCADFSCQVHPFCLDGGKVGESTFELCGDGVDNDSDGFVDCADPECSAFKNCKGSYKKGEICDDQKDNDGDGLIDCADSECREHSSCTENACEQDPYKYTTKADGCACGQSKDMYGECATNLDSSNFKNALNGAQENSHFILRNHVNLGKINDWTPLKDFKGTIDGGGFTLSGWVNCKEKECGLFKSITESKVGNLIVALTITGDNSTHLGSLAALSDKSTFEKVTSRSKVQLDIETEEKNKDAFVGNLVGQSNDKTTFKNIRFYRANVTVNYKHKKPDIKGGNDFKIMAGGLAGYAKSNTVNNVTGSVIVTASDNYKGHVEPALQNQPENPPQILETPVSAGGLYGRVSESRIENVSLEGRVKGATTGTSSLDIGGLVGAGEKVTLKNIHNECQLNAEVGLGSAITEISAGCIVGNLAGNEHGHMVGDSKPDLVNESSVKGTIEVKAGTSNASYIGGVVGVANKDQIMNVMSDVIINVMDVKSTTTLVGGILGYNFSASEDERSEIANGVAMGSFLASSSSPTLGGIVGHMQRGILINTYSNIQLPQPKKAQDTDPDVKFSGAALAGVATNSANIYESYWSENQFKAAAIVPDGESALVDNSVQKYKIEAEPKVQLDSGWKALKGVLNYNVGLDGGTASTNLPKNVTYLRWKDKVTTKSDDVKWPLLTFEKVVPVQ